MEANSTSNAVPQWMQLLNEEDLVFIRRFVLASGSLKAIAAEYGVSYPTVRLRLDRLIAKVQIAERQQEMSGFERLLRARYADGDLDAETFKAVLAAHRAELEKRDGQGDKTA